jgi:hypothetical protein
MSNELKLNKKPVDLLKVIMVLIGCEEDSARKIAQNILEGGEWVD